MANNHSISTFLETELGEAFDSIINPSGYGSATFLVKEFLEKHKDELIAFWNKQGKDGQATFEKLYNKWSLTKAQQDASKTQKKLEKHNTLVKQYVALGETKESAENFASLFPESNPLDILRGKNYNTQNKPIEAKIENVETQQERIERIKALREELRLLNQSLKSLEGTPELPKAVTRIQEIKKELESESQQQPRPNS